MACFVVMWENRLEWGQGSILSELVSVGATFYSPSAKCSMDLVFMLPSSHDVNIGSISSIHIASGSSYLYNRLYRLKPLDPCGLRTAETN